MTFSFKKIDMGSFSANKIPMVSLQNDGRLRFSQEAIRRFELTTYLYAIVYYDVEADAVAIRFTNQWERGVLKMPQNKIDDRSILILKFLHRYDITYKRKARIGKAQQRWRFEFKKCDDMEDAYYFEGIKAAGEEVE